MYLILQATLYLLVGYIMQGFHPRNEIVLSERVDFLDFLVGCQSITGRGSGHSHRGAAPQEVRSPEITQAIAELRLRITDMLDCFAEDIDAFRNDL